MKRLSAGLISTTILAGVLCLSPAAMDVAVSQSSPTRVIVDREERSRFRNR
jgi:hypothetical protein